MSSSILGTTRGPGTSTKIRRSSIAAPRALDIGAFARRAPRIRPMVVRPLPEVLRSGVESLSGVSMRDVRVHYNSPEPDRLGALAYARGTDIHVSPGQERHVPHEAWHVVQQAQGRVARFGTEAHGTPVSIHPTLEREADTIGPGHRAPARRSTSDAGLGPGRAAHAARRSGAAGSQGADRAAASGGNYLDDNEEPWGGETAHPYYTMWKTNELGAYGIGSKRLKELSGSVQLIRAFGPDNVEIRPEV